MLPFYFNYQSLEEIDEQLLIRLFNLDSSLLAKHSEELGLSLLDVLKENILLSEDAKCFLIQSQIYKANLPISPYFDSLGLMFIPAGCYHLANKWIQNSKTKLIKIGSIIIGYLYYVLYSKQLQYYQNRYSYWSIFQSNQQTSSAIESDKYFNGGKEYLMKMQTIMKILNENTSQNKSSDWKQILIHYLLPSTYYPIEKQLNDIDYFNRLHRTNQLTILNLFKNDKLINSDQNK